ncbi:ATP-binding protein [Thermostaphylospora chromogena]|uniref:ATP-binding protein n=1 Tax=Thermostaphylospora chromogena TaxID=35622 RepID=UPI001F622C99|nr:ATP-binding protein [Thermostaphylospora chromogena]
MQSANAGAVLTHAQWTTLDWRPPVGWWPDAARDLLTGLSDPVDLASATYVLSPRPDSIQRSRAFAAGTLAGWGLSELRENVELVVSELATNALRHGLRLADRRPHASVRLSLIRRGHMVACAIADPGSAAPVLRHPGPLEPGGLGLHIVQSLSERWGWAPLAPYGKIVWAVIAA